MLLAPREWDDEASAATAFETSLLACAIERGRNLAMAEPPHPWTTLLAARDWEGFAAAMNAAGCARVGSAELAAAARAEHARLAAQRHPPGPTVELLTIQRLVAAGALSHAALKDFAP